MWCTRKRFLKPTLYFLWSTDEWSSNHWLHCSFIPSQLHLLALLLLSCNCDSVVLDEGNCSQFLAKLFEDDNCINQLGLTFVEAELRFVITHRAAHHLWWAQQIAFASKNLLLQVGNLGGCLFGLAQDSPQGAIQGPWLIFYQWNGRVQQIFVNVGMRQLGQFWKDGRQLETKCKPSKMTFNKLWNVKIDVPAG